MTRCIALLSSGLDSTVGIALAIEQKTRIDLALTYDYGQRAAQNEIEHAGKIADYFDIPFQVITLDWFRNLGKSALTTNSLTLPNPDLHALDDQKSAEASADAAPFRRLFSSKMFANDRESRLAPWFRRRRHCRRQRRSVQRSALVD